MKSQLDASTVEAPADSRTAIAGIDIGGTKIAAILVGLDGSVLARGTVPAPAKDGGDAMADAAAELATQLADDVDVTIAAAGVGAAGVVDHLTGEIVASSATFMGWTGYALRDELSRRLSVPVTVENDVNAFLLGEVTFGAASERDVLGVMLGTGVGGALVINGALRHGPHGAAGEIGHTPGYSDLVCTCGQTGHLETLASGLSIGLRYAEATGTDAVTAREVADLARGGDVNAQAVWAAAGRAVALACSSAATLIDVAEAVIGGGVAESWDLLAPAIAATLETDAPVTGIPLSIKPASLHGDAVALGAASAARSAFQLGVTL